MASAASPPPHPPRKKEVGEEEEEEDADPIFLLSRGCPRGREKGGKAKTRLLLLPLPPPPPPPVMLMYNTSSQAGKGGEEEEEDDDATHPRSQERDSPTRICYTPIRDTFPIVSSSCATSIRFFERRREGGKRIEGKQDPPAWLEGGDGGWRVLPSSSTRD